jgi:hypothetical protein
MSWCRKKMWRVSLAPDSVKLILDKVTRKHEIFFQASGTRIFRRAGQVVLSRSWEAALPKANRQCARHQIR